MSVVRLLIGGALALIGGAVAVLAMVREWLADPLGLDWLNISSVDDQTLGGGADNWLLFLAGAVVFSIGAWIAGRTDDWLG